jgi:prolipoprotein diacylglyceryltransferase
MKTKSLILEILIILISLGMSAYVIKHQMDIHKPIEDILIKTFIVGFPTPVFYWVMKSKIQSSNHPNPEKPLRIWQYLVLGFLVSSILFEIMISYKMVERSIKDIGILWLVWMIVYGNFRVKIEPFYQEPIHFFVADEDIQKRAKRFSGKVMVLGGILSLILLLVLPESLVGYVLIGYFLSFGIAPFFYGKILQWRKVA